MEIARVSLHLFTEVDGEMCAVCQVRGDYDVDQVFLSHKKGPLAGTLQPLVTGKLNNPIDKSLFMSLYDRMEEQAGAVWRDGTASELEDAEPLITGSTASWMTTCVLFSLWDIKLSVDTGGIRLIRLSDLEAMPQYELDQPIPNGMHAEDKAAMKALWPLQ